MTERPESTARPTTPLERIRATIAHHDHAVKAYFKYHTDKLTASMRVEDVRLLLALADALRNWQYHMPGEVWAIYDKLDMYDTPKEQP